VACEVCDGKVTALRHFQRAGLSVVAMTTQPNCYGSCNFDVESSRVRLRSNRESELEPAQTVPFLDVWRPSPRFLCRVSRPTSRRMQRDTMKCCRQILKWSRMYDDSYCREDGHI
jgi:hypothetical protein